MFGWIRCFSASLVMITATQCFAQTSSDFFDDSTLQVIRLNVATTDWDTLRANFQDNTYYPADFTWNDIKLRIAIRSRV